MGLRDMRPQGGCRPTTDEWDREMLVAAVAQEILPQVIAANTNLIQPPPAAEAAFRIADEFVGLCEQRISKINKYEDQ